MIKGLLHYLNYGIFSELALVMFMLIFIAIVIRTLRTSSDQINYESRIVLRDDPKE